MEVYLGTDFKVYGTLADDRTAFEDSFFDNKCTNLVESYRYIPVGETWIREDGEKFTGMIAPWRDIRQYDGEQSQYLFNQLIATQEALAEAPTVDEITTAIQEGVNSI